MCNEVSYCLLSEPTLPLTLRRARTPTYQKWQRAAGLGVPLLTYRMSATMSHRSLLPDLLSTDARSRGHDRAYLRVFLLSPCSLLDSRGDRVPPVTSDSHFHIRLLERHQATIQRVVGANDIFMKVQYV